MRQRVEGFGIEMNGPVEGIRSTGEVAGLLLGEAQQITWTALRGQERDRLAQRLGGCGGVGLEQQDAEVQLRFGHFGVDGDALLVFGAGVVGAFQCGICIGELEMGVGDVRLFGDEFLEWVDCGGEIVPVEGGLRLVEKVVQGVTNFLRFAWSSRGAWVLFCALRRGCEGKHL